MYHDAGSSECQTATVFLYNMLRTFNEIGRKYWGGGGEMSVFLELETLPQITKFRNHYQGYKYKRVSKPTTKE
jgi:hypothetical protein